MIVKAQVVSESLRSSPGLQRPGDDSRQMCLFTALSAAIVCPSGTVTPPPSARGRSGACWNHGEFATDNWGASAARHGLGERTAKSAKLLTYLCARMQMNRCVQVRTSSIVLRPMLGTDRGSVQRLLSFLPRLYPNGAPWLERRLDDVFAEKARCTVAVLRRRLVGIAIETPKGHRRLKLSTIYVHPSHRSLGVGKRLLERARRQWLLAGIREVWVTANAEVSPELAPLVSRVGFEFTTLQSNRYGDGRDEVIFTWLSDKPCSGLPLCKPGTATTLDREGEDRWAIMQSCNHPMENPFR
jgi:GNAT superfamily N-acetyltransferase